MSCYKVIICLSEAEDNIKREGHASCEPAPIKLELVIEWEQNKLEYTPSPPISALEWEALEAAAVTGGIATWNSKFGNMHIVVRGDRVAFHAVCGMGASTQHVPAEHCGPAFAKARELVAESSLKRNRATAGDFVRANPFKAWPFDRRERGTHAYDMAKVLYERIGSDRFEDALKINHDVHLVTQDNALDMLRKYAPKNDAVRALIEYYRGRSVV